MAVVYVDLDAQYQIRTDNEHVLLKVVIGDGQVGAYDVFLGRELIGCNEQVDLGTRQDLAGKRTLVVTTIRDTLLETNWTSMTVILSEGDIKTKIGPFTKEVPKHLDTSIFTLSITNL